MSELRERLERFSERVPLNSDAWARLERARRRHERRRRVAALIVAGVVAVAGIFVAVSAFGPPSSSKVGGTTTRKTTAGFLSLWPQGSVDLGSASLGEAEARQEQADDGDPSAMWQLSPEVVASRFAEQELGWSDVLVDSVTGGPDGSVVVTIGMRAECTQLPPEGSIISGSDALKCDRPLAYFTHAITLSQPVVSGADGIWEVVEVHPANASEFDLGIARGQTLFAGQGLRFNFGDVPPGAVGLVAASDCTVPVDVAGVVTVDPNHSVGAVHVPLDLNTGDCASPNGYLYAYSVITPGSRSVERQGDPFKTSAVIGEIAIVPVELSSTTSPTPDSQTSSSVAGSAAVRLPDLAGSSFAEAEAELDKLGLASTVVYLASDVIQQGVVTGTTPEPRALIDGGTSVELHVSAGPAMNEAGFGWIQRVFDADPGVLVGLYRGPNSQGVAAISDDADPDLWRSRIEDVSNGRPFTVTVCPTTKAELDDVSARFHRMIDAGQIVASGVAFGVDPRTCSVLLEGSFTPGTIQQLETVFGESITIVDGVESSLLGG